MKMQEIIYLSIKSVQDQIEGRSRSFELFGYDFLIDQEYNPWLIEVNSSPSLDYSTHITERLVKQALEDCVKVVVDHGINRKTKNTGQFALITKRGKFRYPHQYVNNL